MAKPPTISTPHDRLGLTPEGFWRLPIADREWLWVYLGVTETAGRQLLSLVGAESVKVGTRTFIFPRELAKAFGALAQDGRT